ncbi:MAG: hypothetical protein OEZ39_08500 [Gammaproteobacteria bacterium]|nr:hypothetical protein [Gammaproteobacteria bacterium]MDH5651902.1 hypothetical protein [Gammaproteobacteria bacterium]
MTGHSILFKSLILAATLLLLAACTAGNEQFTPDKPAGFFYGLWHGVISIITLLIQIFSDTVKVYEPHNTGGWYDFGFLSGVLMVWGSGSHYKTKSAAEKKREQEWEEISDKVEARIMRKMKDWAETEESQNHADRDEWNEIGDKVEKKLKRKLREWAEKED